MDALRPFNQRRAVLMCMALLVMALMLVATGCGDDEKSSSGSDTGASTGQTTEPAAKKPTGEPIKTMTIASVDYNGPTYQNILETAKLYEKWINDNGGINGRPLEVLTCDEKGNPTQTSACGREATKAGVVADVGSFSYNGATIVPLYEKAKTAWFGICCAIAPEEFKSKVSFPIGNNPALNPGGVYKAAQDGCKKIGLLELDLPTTPALNELFKNAAKAGGYTGELKFVKVALTTKDYTPQVAEATSGTDCISMYLSESNISALMPAFAQTGGKQRLYGAQGNFNKVSVKGFEDLVKDHVVYGMYPSLDSPAFKDFKAALEKYNPPEELDYDSLGGLGTWAAFTAFTEVVKGMSGEINNETFLEAASTAKVDTGGMVPPLDFSQEYTGLDGQYPRAFNLSETYFTNPAEPKQEGEFVDLRNAIEGKTS